MPTSERDIMADNDAHFRHQNPTSSDTNKAVVPMWDSSDPERAPPPLPMNPSSPSLISKSNTSSIIQSAHVALAEKAWESGYVTNPPPKRIEYSPERFMMKGVAHKRIKSLQPGVEELSSPLERVGSVNGPRSPGKGPGRRGSTYMIKEIFLDSKSPEKEPKKTRTGRFSERDHMFTNEEKSPEKPRNLRNEEKLTESHIDLDKNMKKEGSSRSNTPSPDHYDNLSRDLARTHTSPRKPQQSILGENMSPQSATMLALQSMASKEENTRLTNISNSSNALVRTPHTFDAISNQILSLTSIATNLQKEMAQLSRRSKDNATDLISLKEATNARDEDIRRSLRELVHNLSENGSRSSSNIQESAGFYLDDKLHNYPMPRMKAFSLPRIPSPTGFASSLDRESVISPASYVADGVAIIALLEKVLREMGTREGQKHIMSKISEFLSRDESSTEKKVDDLIMLIKANISDSDSPSRYGGSVRLNRSRTLSLEPAPRLELEFDKLQSVPLSGAVALKSSTNDKKSSHETQQGSIIISDDTVNIIRTIKDSVTQGGGLTAEVKALVRELRGEVLGMGREITRKLDEVNEESIKTVATEKEHVSRILKNGIEDWKTHVDHILREYRRQSSASIASKTSVDHREVCKAVRDAIVEMDKSQSKNLEKEDILNAVRDAWEGHKPEIKFQQFWPGRDEILNCIKEGIQAFFPQNNTPAMSGVTREEIYEAVVEGLKCIPLPSADTVAKLSREEILNAVKQCLEEFEFPLPSSQNKSSEIEVTRDVLLDAVKEGLKSFDFSSCIKSSLVDTNMYLTRHEILGAIQDGYKGLEASKETNESARNVDEIQRNFREESNTNLIDKSEMDALIGQICEKFKNILDSTRTELEALSREAKNDFSSSSKATEKLLDTTQDWFEKLRTEIEEYIEKTSGHEIMNTMLDIQSNIDSLHAELERLTSNSSPGSPAIVLAEIENLRDMLSASNIFDSEAVNSDFLTTLQDELENIKDVISSSLSSPDFVVERTEILSAIKDGFDCAKEEIELSRNFETNSEQMDILNAIKANLEDIKGTLSSSLIPTTSVPDKNEIIDAIIEIKEAMSSSLITTSSRLDKYEILKAISEGLDNFKEVMSSSLVPTSSGPDKYEILDAIKDVKESVSSSLVPTSSRPDKHEILDAIKDVKETVSSSLVLTGSGPDKYEILDAIKDVKETVSSSLVPTSSGPDKYEILDAIKDVKETVSSSLVLTGSGPDKYEILDAIKDVKETVSSSLVPTSSGPDKYEILDAIKDVKETVSSSLVLTGSGPDKYEILDAIKDVKETVSSSLVPTSSRPDKYEILDAIKDVKETVSSSLVLTGSGPDKYEILDAIKDVKETVSSSLVPTSSGPDKYEILDAIKDVKETVSSSLVPTSSGSDKQEISNTIKDGLENIKNIISSSLMPTSSVIDQKEFSNIIRDSFDSLKDAMLSSISTNNSRLHNEEILDVVKEIKETVSSSLISESLGLDKDLILDAINDGFDNIKNVMSSSLSTNNSGVYKDEILNAIKDIKGTMYSSLSTDSSGLHNEEILDVVKEIKETVSSSLISESLGLDKDLILDAINDGFDNLKNVMSSSLSTNNSGVYKDEILNAIKDIKGTMYSSLSTDSLGLQKEEFVVAIKEIKEIVSSSLTSESLGLDKALVLEAINDGFDKIKDAVSPTLPTDDFDTHKDEILDAIKDMKESISTSIITENLELDKALVLEAINDGFDNIKDTISSTLPTDNSEIHKDEIMNAIKDMKESISTSLITENLELDKALVLEAINDGFDNIKDTISSTLPTDNSEIHKDEIMKAIKDMKETMSFTLPTDSSGLHKDEILDVIKDGLENLKDTILSSIILKSSGIEKDDISNVIREGLDNIKEIMTTSIIPTTLELDKNIVLVAINEGFSKMRETILSSSSNSSPGLHNNEILEEIKDGFENFKETISSSLIPGNIGFDKEIIIQIINDSFSNVNKNIFSNLSTNRYEILEAIKDAKEDLSSLQPGNTRPEINEILITIKDSLEKFKENLSTSLVPRNPGLDKHEILFTIRDSLENLKENLSISLESRNSGLDKDEISNAVKNGLESFKEIMTSSLVPRNSGPDKDEILLTIAEGLESFKENLSTSLAPRNTGPDKDEILLTIRDSLENFKEILSTSLASKNSGLDKDEISNAVKNGLESFKEIMTSSLVPGNSGPDKDEILLTIAEGLESFKENLSTSLAPRNTGPDKDEILLTIRDSLENFKEILSTSLASKNSGLDKDEISNAVKNGLESFKEIMTSSLVPGNSGSDKDEILLTIADGLENFKEILSTSLASKNSGLDKDEISNAVKNGLESFKEIMTSSLVPGNSGPDKDEILLTIAEGLESFKENLSTSLAPRNTGPDKDEILLTIRDSLENFKENLLTSLVPGNSGPDKDEILLTIADGLENFKEILSTSLASKNSGLDKDEISNAVKNGLESFKEIMTSSLVPGNSGSDKDEILLTIADGLENFKEILSTSLVPGNSDIDKNEILIAIKDDMENLKKSISHQTISFISESGIDVALQALKGSIDGIKEDLITQQSKIDHLGTGEILDTVKVGLSNFQIEVEKVINKPSDLADVGLSKEIFDTLQMGLEDARADINRLQKTIQDQKTTTELNTPVTSLDLLRRNDIESLESLMTDLRSKVETRELVLSSSEVNQVPISKNSPTDLDDMLKNIQKSIADLALRDQTLDQESMKKEDLRSIENLLADTKVKIEELDIEPSVTKEDFNALEFLIGETRENLSNLSNHLEDVSKRDDTKIFEPIVRDVLFGIEKLKEFMIKSSENPDEVKKMDIFAIESTCSDIKNAIDHVLISEIASLASKEDVKDLEAQLKEFKGQVDKHAESNSSKSEERHFNIIKLSETIKKFLEEFENSLKIRLGEGLTSIDSLRKLLEDFGQALIQDSKITDEIKFLSDIIKGEFEKSTALVVGSKVEIDEKFQQTWDKFDTNLEKKINDLLLKYDDARVVAEGANKLSEEKMTMIESALRGTEMATEDLKLLASHLSTSLTDSLVTIDKNSNTVSYRLDATHSRLQEIHVETKTENQQIRDDMAKLLRATEAIDNALKEYGPKTSESIKDLVSVANKQYEHSLSSVASLEEKIIEKLPKLDLESSSLFLPPSPQPTEKYDDSSVHQKLDKLADEMHITSKSFVQLDILEKVHQQVIKTAAEVSEYFTAQKKQNSLEYDENKRAVEEINNIVEKKLIEKKNIEVSVLDLRMEEEILKKSIVDLKAEQEGLTLQKTRLYSEVSSLETALRIRREELDVMEVRAGNLERRIIESVIDHSRSLLITNKNKGREVMSRKRVPSHNGPMTSPSRSQALNMTKVAVDMVIGDNISSKKNPPGVSRRILSLSQITNNLAPGQIKRSHSVKSSSDKPRKNSWGGTFGREDRNATENHTLMKESEDDCLREIYANLGENFSSNIIEATLLISAESASNKFVTDDETAGSLECQNVEIDEYSDAESTVIAEARCPDTISDECDEESGSKPVDEEVTL